MQYPIEQHWYDDHPGWYQYKIFNTKSDLYLWLEHCSTIIDWVKENIDGSYRHCRWTCNVDDAVFAFRYERDYLPFILRWS